MFVDDNRSFLADQRAAPEHSTAARGAAQLLADLGVSFRPLPYCFRVDAETHAELLRATEVLVRAQEKLLAHLVATLSAAELVELFDIPPAMAARTDLAGLASSGLRMVRADIIPTDDGYWFCELNHFSGVGAGEAFHSAALFAELLDRPVAGVSPFRQLARLYVAECRRRGLSRVVVLDSPEHRKQGFGEHRMLQRYLHLTAPDLELDYLDELSYPARWLEPAEARRTLVHRVVTFDDTPDEGAFIATLRDRGATVSCLFEAELKMHRRWFSLLCDVRHHHLLDDEERAVVQRYVPHTADLRADDLDAALADRDGLVFKRSYTYGGKGVLLGDQHSAAELRALLGADLSAWVVQRRVRTSVLDLPGPDGAAVPHHWVLGAYLYGDRASGLLVRGSAASPVVNVSQGGGVSWAFVE